MPIFEIGVGRIQKLAETTFARAGLRKREDLQRLLRDQVEVVAPDAEVLAGQLMPRDCGTIGFSAPR